MTITSRDETPVVIPATNAADEDLVGILTAPGGNANGAAVLSLWGGGGVPAFGKNQARVRLSRELAARGFHALRFSYTGVGESGGLVREPDIGNEWVDDTVAALRWLESRGFQRIVVIGLCAGGRAALAAAPQVGALAGLALVSCPLGDGGHREGVLDSPLSWYLRRLTSPRSLLLLVRGEKAKRRRAVLRGKLRRVLLGRRGKSSSTPRRFLPQVEHVLDRGTPVLFLYGRDDDFASQFDQARDDALGRAIQRQSAQVAVQLVDGRLDGLGGVAVQETFLRTVLAWIATLNFPTGDVEQPTEDRVRIPTSTRS